MSLRLGITAGGILWVLSGCASRTPRTPLVLNSPKPRSPLVVLVVLDQVGSWVLDQRLGALDSDGGLRFAINQGAFHHRVRYEYSVTDTAAGHAAIVSGAPPSQSGIERNYLWDRKRHAPKTPIGVGDHSVFGVDGEVAGPDSLRVQTVGDVLRERYPLSLVVSMSLKDRPAVVAGGKKATLALWYDSRAKGFTTSTYYGPTLPQWVRSWQNQHPIEAWIDTPWTLLDARAVPIACGADDAPGERDEVGFTRHFPHAPRAANDPFALFGFTPMAADALLSLAEQGVETLGLGTDASPDLLIVSISTTDLIGHAFGPDSWESFDNLIRVDRALGRFFAHVSRLCASVLITADHGVAPLPERTRALGGTAHRIDDKALVDVMDRAIDEVLGDGDWIEALVGEFGYFTDAALDVRARPRAVRAAIQAAKRVPGVYAAYDTHEARHWRDSNDPLERAVAMSIADEPSGDIYIVPRPYSILQGQADGTTHGTPWPYDTDVPVLFFGPGVRHVETRGVLPQKRVAATLAALLGIPPPEGARVPPLPGIGSASR